MIANRCAANCHHSASLGRREFLAGLSMTSASLLGGSAAEEPAPGNQPAKAAAAPGALAAGDPLAGLPSKPGPHVERIRAMGPDTWLFLGAPAADATWGKARGRSWTPKMAYAPDLRVAFLYGSGQHGFLKPDGHYQDDLWAYDLNAHRWICVWPGMGGSPKHPWFYDVAAARWQRMFVAGPGPDRRCESVLEDLPGRNQAFFLYHEGVVWLYDYAANQWTNAAVSGPRPPFGIDPVACYDTKRDRIYACRNAALWVYDAKTNACFTPQPKGRPAAGEQGGGRDMTMTYDIAHDVVVLNVYRDTPQQKGIYIYDPAANAWTSRPRPIPAEITPRVNLNAMYDPHWDVHVYHGAGDSEDNGMVWVYRCGAGVR